MELLFAVGTFKRSDDEEESHHAKGAKKECRSTTNLVEEENGRESKGDVENVLDRRGEEWVTNTGSFHDIDDVVHHDIHSTKLGPHLD